MPIFVFCFHYLEFCRSNIVSLPFTKGSRSVRCTARHDNLFWLEEEAGVIQLDHPVGYTVSRRRSIVAKRSVQTGTPRKFQLLWMIVSFCCCSCGSAGVSFSAGVGTFSFPFGVLEDRFCLEEDTACCSRIGVNAEIVSLMPLSAARFTIPIQVDQIKR